MLMSSGPGHTTSALARRDPSFCSRAWPQRAQRAPKRSSATVMNEMWVNRPSNNGSYSRARSARSVRRQGEL